MGILDNLATNKTGNLGGGKGGLVMSILRMMQNRQGGVSGLLQSFEQHGMGDAAKSWMGNGENQPISPDQVKETLGHEQIEQVAQESGMSHEQASSGIASLLPNIIDKLTPNGQAPAQGDLMSKGAEMLKGHFGF